MVQLLIQLNLHFFFMPTEEIIQQLNSVFRKAVFPFFMPMEEMMGTENTVVQEIDYSNLVTSRSNRSQGRPNWRDNFDTKSLTFHVVF